MSINSVEWPTNLSFISSITVSPGLMYSTNNFPSTKDEYKKTLQQIPVEKIEVKEHTVLGTISHFVPIKEENKEEEDINKTNIQKIDSAYLNKDHKVLKLDFSLNFKNKINEPNSCYSSDFKKSYDEFIKYYKKNIKFLELAKRYAMNIANARFLWRNRDYADKIKTYVTTKFNGDSEGEEKILEYESFNFPLDSFDINNKSLELEELAKLIEKSFSSDKVLTLNVSCFVKMSSGGHQVYPSQEFMDKINSNKKGAKNKFLYSKDGTAAMHCQKIGNSIRTIDTWYPKDNIDEFCPIPVEIYGYVKRINESFRLPQTKKDFYTLCLSLVTKFNSDIKEEDINIEKEDFNYVISCLIRGGVFGISKKKDK